MTFSRTDFIAFFLILAALVYAVAKPIWDWDLIAYLFAAKQVLGASAVEAHGWVYAQVQALPEVWRADLLGREDFRRVVAGDPEALRQLMPFYADRAGYYGLLAGLMALGVPALWAVQGVGLVALALLGGVVWVWGRRMLPAWGALVLLAVVMAFPSVMKVVRWSNPDGMVAALYVLGVFGWVGLQDLRVSGSQGLRRRLAMEGWALAWLGMILLRPNSAVLLLPLGVMMLAQREWGKAVLLAGLGLIAVEMHALLPGYGVMMLWKHTFEGAMAYPALEVKPAFDFSYYLGLLKVRMLGLHGRDLLLFILMWVSVFGIRHSAFGRATPGYAGFAAALVAGVMLQVMVFPGFWERLYVGPVLALVLLATPCAVRGICGKA